MTHQSGKSPRSILLLLALPVLLALSGCADHGHGPAQLALRPVGFADLPGWTADAPLDALPALTRSCTSFGHQAADHRLGVAGTISDWLPACTALKQAPPATQTALRRWLADWFQPYQAVGPDGQADGLFTGYYEAELPGSLTPDATYKTPLYARPGDLVSVDLGDFKTELQGKRVVGKVAKQKLVPYDDRAAISSGSLKDRAKVLAYVSDPVAAFFLEVQGSGRITLPDDITLHVGYDAQNGRDFVPIGRVMAARGDIARPVTMQKIRAWLTAHPDQMPAVLNENPSVVFFRAVDSDGAVGAQGVTLTPGRSLAVDPAFVPLGVPLWLDAENSPAAKSGGARLQRLMVAQDTGGAIKGPQRGDVFWGNGADAEAAAGAMQSHGRYYLLLPKSRVAAR